MNVENPERPRRHSGQQLQQVRRETVERRSSKNSASRDRYGKIYSESFRDQTIRAVPPELPPTTSHDIDVPSSSYASNPVSPSPRVLRRTKLPQRRREPSTSVSNTDEETTIDSRRRKSKARDKKLEDSPSESSPNSFMTKTRQRIGSITTSTSLIQKTAEDLSGSIGYPSIIQSPVRPPQSASRQRLAKAIPHTPLSAHEDPVTDSSPSPQQTTNGSDSSKILQTMKTTCGRMHGILFFRPTYTAPWASGYCAINVASGSLIYQVKGELSNTKTLIPDLRGCSVRTLCDAESGRMYLSVSTASSGLGIQLRPSVPETFDSWLAALLCWQPIRPKGVQNKMTKPQSFSMVGRRSADRRRTSEVTVQKSSPIIKVGKMLLWQGSTSADPDPDSSKRVSTYKQLRAISPCWQRVSCTLNENGHFKLLTEGDAQLIMFIQLSHLSRCSVQQLDPSVLDDEFCIALYPQYTAYTGSQVQSRPIFLSLETRVLFEVWFVLLRAFTIPELYGPKQSPNDESSPSSPTYQHAAATPPGMFRIERSLFVRVTEAKLKGPFEHREPSMKVRGKAGSATRALSNRDCYAEILLDGGIRARTATKTHQSSAFWREEFMFSDLSPVLSTASVLIKYRNPAEKEWTMIPRGQYDPSQGDSSSVAVGAEIEVSAYDTVYGRVDLQLDDFDKGIDVDRWWQVLGANGLVVGDLLMKIRLEETVVLMKDDYTPLLNLLQSFSNGLTVQIARVLSTKLNQLTDIFLDLFQVSALASEWIMSLVEDEIDGLSREGPTNRLRWSTRMQSNDSYESSENREILVRDLGRSAAIEANLLFRGNSLLTKALDSHMRRLGKDYLEETIGERLRDIDESDPECEVDPNRVRAPNELNRNWTNLIALTSHVWRAIAASATRCPPELRLLFRHIRSCAEDRYGAFLRTVSYSSVSGFLFLRFFCPAILNPKLFGLLKGEHAERTSPCRSSAKLI